MNSNPSSSSSSSLRRNWLHHVFPSFHGADVRRSFLSHILKELRSKGIDSFIDNDIMRGEFIGPELEKAIKGSRIAIVLLSSNYASSSWCLDELAEIIKCKEDLGQTVMTIFYEVDSTDVQNQAGHFGEVFRKTCNAKTKEHFERWIDALVQVAQIAGYHSTNWATEAEMIEDIATDVLKMLTKNSTPSRDLDGFIGTGSHMEKMKPLLCIDSNNNEARMIGIWGPHGIGKTTIARCLFDEYSGSFELSVFMENIKSMYTTPICLDDYTTKLDLQQKFMSLIINEKDIRIRHLGVAQERLKNKKVLVILDDVDQLVQLEAIAKDTRWFGPGSRIIITTQDLKLLKAHGVDHIYKVGASTESLQIFCTYAFGQNSPKDGFEMLAREATVLAGQIPLRLRVVGSYFRRKSPCEKMWEKALVELRSRLDIEIETVLKFSYDALCEKDKDLFLHLTCFFNFGSIEIIESYLAKTFLDFRQGIDVLVEKSLVSIVSGYLEIDHLLVQLGREIVRKKYGTEPGKYSIRKPAKRKFLVDSRDIFQVLSDDTADSTSVIGLDLSLSETDDDEIDISERAFERMSNLQFLRISGACDVLFFPQSLNSISRKLRYINWMYFPMPSLPSNFDPKFLINLSMQMSQLEELWGGDLQLRNLKWVNLSHSKNLKELPNLSNAINLEVLDLTGCSSLVELPSFHEATNLTSLHLSECSSLVELPSSIGNTTLLKELNLANCSTLVELPFSFGNLHNLWKLTMDGCSKLKVLPININLKSLEELYLRNCSLLKTFPEISTNIKLLKLNGTPIEEVPLATRSWSRFEELHMSYCENLKDSPHALNSITDLHLTNTEIQELGPWVKGFSRLRRLLLNGSQKLVSLPHLPDSLLLLDAENCESLERLDSSFRNPDTSLNFFKCFKLNQDARDLIIQASNSAVAVIPGEEVPAYFSDRATGGTVTVKLNEWPLQKPLRFKACVVLVNKVDNEPRGVQITSVSYKIIDKKNGVIVPCIPEHLPLPRAVTFTGHLYTFGLEVDGTSNELSFEFTVFSKSWDIKECGVLQLS
ncbi:PREDICTED: probable disease resistance protein RPP1 [Camelina sativa]|uniref:ADP-ribosyl cyclase/cyclic ADP-ribose hydrolase n=1 Tax=Camelina sativa TaxID=90675 RepID=A0ABM1RCE6_CAMSA|nr:PREDICTED: probable disease resistance protein RPP1 [Camelina sativa]